MAHVRKYGYVSHGQMSIASVDSRRYGVTSRMLNRTSLVWSARSASLALTRRSRFTPLCVAGIVGSSARPVWQSGKRAGFTASRDYSRASQAQAIQKVKQPKKKAIQKLRHTDPQFNRESTTYILSLLNKNDSTEHAEVLDRYLSPVTSLTAAEQIDFSKLPGCLGGLEFETVVPDEVVNVDFEGKEVMILSNGTIVGWGLTEEIMENEFLPLIEEALIKKSERESEEMDWIELENLPDNPLNKGNSYLQGEIMVVQGKNNEKRTLDRIAFAIGMSRSTRLSILENNLESHLQLTRENSENLAKGIITTSEENFLKLTGRLLILRGRLNLYSELIETPDLYWSEPTLEKIYESTSKVLDISPRISIMNRKLDYAIDEQRAFLSVLNEKKGTKLEWIIIILIMVEVGFESFHFYEKYSRDVHQDAES